MLSLRSHYIKSTNPYRKKSALRIIGALSLAAGLAVCGCRARVGADGETVYFLNEDVWRMAADAEELPAQPYIRAHETIYYALGVDPHSGDLYLGDAIDYQQQGVVYRFSAEGVPLDTLRVGITPTAFCFR